MRGRQTSASHVAIPLALVVLRATTPDYGRPPRGRPLWQGGVLLLMSAALLLLARGNWL